MAHPERLLSRGGLARAVRALVVGPDPQRALRCGPAPVRAPRLLDGPLPILGRAVQRGHERDGGLDAVGFDPHLVVRDRSVVAEALARALPQHRPVEHPIGEVRAPAPHRMPAQPAL